MIGTIANPHAAVEIGEAFGAASADIRQRLGRSHRREEEGQAATREDTFTDDLVEALERSISERLAAISERLTVSGTNVRVQFDATKAIQGEESTFGLDLGIRVVVETPGYVTEKAILVQCKRMYGLGDTGEFPKLRGDGEAQAAKMLRVTPASFFFLFSGGDHHTLWEMMRSSTLLPWPDRYFWPEFGSLDRAYFDPGVTVLPATRVLAMSEASKTAGSKFPVGARDVLAGSLPLGHFIAGLFAPCVVGDVRTGVLRLATPPTLRDSVAGVDADMPELGSLEPKRFHRIKIEKIRSQ